MRKVFQNCLIFTAAGDEGPSNKANCMVTNDDVIEYIGDEADETVLQAQKGGAQAHDLKGRTVAPGFIDGHMHLILFGSSLEKGDFDKCQNLDDIRAVIRKHASENPTAKRLYFQNWMHFMTDSKALASTIDDLDPRPIFIFAKDLHSAWCNSAAMDEMGVQNMQNPEGGEILRDENGKATGLLSETAALKIVWPHAARMTSREEKMQQVRAAIRTYNIAGYTGMIEMATDEETWSLVTELREKEKVNIRLAVHWLISPSKTSEENLAQVERAIELHQKFNLETSPDFRIAGIKVICDGVVDACTAALSKPYSSNGINCDPIWSADMLRPVVHKADRAGLQCALHAIGDAAIKLAVDTLEAEGTPGRRHRIEHLELTSPEDAKRLGQLGITASIQPVHSDPAIMRAWPELVGPDRYVRALPYRDFLDNNARIAIGTDSPTAPHYPLENLYIATTKRSAREPELLEPFNEHFKLPMVVAWAAASAGSAYSCFADKRTGTLEAGKLADFVVLNMQWTPEKLLEAVVEQTWFGGEQVYQKA